MHIKTSRKTGRRIIDSKSLVDEFAAKELSRRQMVQAVMLGTVGTWLGASGLAGCTTKTVTAPGAASSGGPSADADGGEHQAEQGFSPAGDGQAQA